MRKPRLVIWDWNGTLQNDAMYMYERGVRGIFRHFNLPCPPFARYRKEISHNYKEFYQRHGIPSHITNDDLNTIFLAGLRKDQERADLFPDARDTLREMASIVEMQHLVSGCPDGTLQEELHFHNLAHAFERVVGNVCDKASVFTDLMRAHGVRGTETLVIGDFSHDAFAAKAAGAQAIICTRGFHSRPYLESLGDQLDGVTIVDNLGEIPRLLSPLTPALPARSSP